MSIITELKQCPFCGCKNLELKEKLDTVFGDLYWVFCYHCEAISGKYGTAHLAKENWNKRESLKEIDEDIGVLLGWCGNSNVEIESDLIQQWACMTRDRIRNNSTSDV